MNMPSMLAGARTRIRRITRAVRDRALEMTHPGLAHAFSITSHLTVEERIVLNRLAKGKRRICEIGSYIGASACCFAAAFNGRTEGRILCIDTWANNAMSEGSRDTHAEFIKNTAPYAHLIEQVRGFSTEVIHDVARCIDFVDLLFIDGDHSYQGVKADWDTYCPLLRPGSVVVFHDCGWAEGVKRVIAEDALPVVTNAQRLPNMWWATVRA
jgi:predicted O-methyltransferase YrrM